MTDERIERELPTRLLFERARDGIDSFAGDGSSELRALDEIERRTTSLERELTATREVVEAARRASKKDAEARAIMRKHGFKFETPLQDSKGFEKLAFTFYTLLCEIASDLEPALSHHDEVPEVRPIESGPVMKRERHG